MYAIMIIALVPFIVPDLKITENKHFNIYGYLVFLFISIIIARGGSGGSYFSTMIFLGMILFVMMVQFIGFEFYSKGNLGRYLDYASILLFLHALSSVSYMLNGRVSEHFPMFETIHFSEAWLGYEL